MKYPPLISIVTPSRNQVRFIGEALQSVQLQSYANCEHLVIDGMSTDGTVDLLRGLTANGEHQNVLWVSERDSGQSEALNKGFRQAKGEIIGWLNSDDRYRVGCFEHIVKAFEDNPRVDVFYGDYLIMNELGDLLQIRREIEFNEFILQYHRILYIPTTATFFRRRVFEENNWLDEKFQYAMDLEFLHSPFGTSDIALSIFRNFLPTLGCRRTVKRAVLLTDSGWNINRLFLQQRQFFAVLGRRA